MEINLLEDQFQILGKINSNATTLVMKVPVGGHVTTRTLPKTTSLLIKYLPSIFKCQCFNDANNSFRKESKNTELGHLFEHILLEYLCIEKLKKGEEKASYEGVTNWNWEKDDFGTFNINIKVGLEEAEIIKKAFRKSTGLIKKILLN